MVETSGWLKCNRTQRRWIVGPGRTVRVEFELGGSCRVGALRDVGPDGVFFEVPSDSADIERDTRIPGATIRFETGEIHGEILVRHVTSGIDAPRGCGAEFRPSSEDDRAAMEAFLRGLADGEGFAGAPGPDDEAPEDAAPQARPSERRIRIQTAQGAIEGSLPVGAGATTMRRLNVVSATQKFLQLRPPVLCTPECVFRDGPLSVVIDSIVFVTEVAEFVPVPEEPQAAARFRRARVILLLKDYLIEGFVHVPPGGDPIVRLNQDRHKFIALTSVTVKTADQEFSVPFMALNGSELLAIQEIEYEEPLEPVGAGTASAQASG